MEITAINWIVSNGFQFIKQNSELEKMKQTHYLEDVFT